MKYRDTLTTTLLAFFVPFYAVYWLYDTAKSLRAQGVKVPPFKLLLIPMIISLISFLIYISYIIIATIQSGNSDQVPAGVIAGTILYYLVILIAGIMSLVYYYKFSAAVSSFSRGELSKGILFVLFWLFNPVAIYMIQDKLNHMFQAPLPQQPVA